MILQRLKRLWELSKTESFSPAGKGGNATVSGKGGIAIGGKGGDAHFIPRIKEKPIDKITKLGEETAV